MQRTKMITRSMFLMPQLRCCEPKSLAIARSLERVTLCCLEWPVSPLLSSFCARRSRTTLPHQSRQFCFRFILDTISQQYSQMRNTVLGSKTSKAVAPTLVETPTQSRALAKVQEVPVMATVPATAQGKVSEEEASLHPTHPPLVLAAPTLVETPTQSRALAKVQEVPVMATVPATAQGKVSEEEASLHPTHPPLVLAAPTLVETPTQSRALAKVQEVPVMATVPATAQGKVSEEEASLHPTHPPLVLAAPTLVETPTQSRALAKVQEVPVMATVPATAQGKVSEEEASLHPTHPPLVLAAPTLVETPTQSRALAKVQEVPVMATVPATAQGKVSEEEASLHPTHPPLVLAAPTLVETPTQSRALAKVQEVPVMATVPATAQGKVSEEEASLHPTHPPLVLAAPTLVETPTQSRALAKVQEVPVMATVPATAQGKVSEEEASLHPTHPPLVLAAPTLVETPTQSRALAKVQEVPVMATVPATAQGKV
jgi:hypothetical protein